MNEELTPEAAKFLELANEGKNIFLTGLAGSGKSHLIGQFLKQTEKKYQVLAPTGIAAINAGGSTIHRFFKLKQGIDPQFQNIEPSVATAIGKLDGFIIDEISMARVDLMESMDDMLKRITMNRSDPFGGKQIILVGDLFQLPPVVDEEYQKYIAPRFNSPFFFDLPEFDECGINIIALKKVWRQTDDNYLKILNHIRVGNGDQMILNVLNSRITKETPLNTIILAPTNKLVDYYNEKEFDKLTSPEYTYTASIQGSFTKDMYPTEEYIRIKEGCQVMMTANGEGYSNGSIGTFLREDEKSVPGMTGLQDILVIDIDGEEIDVPKKTRTIDTPIMEDGKLNRKTIGTFIQFPIKLGYCISIHKCLDANTLVSTTNGLQKISDVQIGDTVNSGFSMQSIIGKSSPMQKEVFRITTKSGGYIDATAEHKMYTFDGQYVYKQVSELNTGDPLISLVNYKTDTGLKKEIVLSYGEKSKVINTPKYINENFSYFVGLLIGDGSYNYKTTKNCGRIDFTNYTPEIKEWYKKYLHTMGIHYTITFKKGEEGGYTFTSLPLRNFLSSMGLTHSIANKKTIPEIFFALDKDSQAGLIKGLFDSDGSASKGKLRYVSVSSDLIQSLKLLLLEFGIYSYIEYRIDKKKNKSYCLHITGKDFAMYGKIIGTLNHRTRKFLNDYISSGKSSVDFIPNGLELIEEFKENCKGISHIGFDRGQIRGYLSCKNLSYHQARDLHSFAKLHGVELPKTDKALLHRLISDPIVKIESLGNREVYDIEVENDHTFIANGFISHNSQGLTFDSMILDPGNGMFAAGQLYVALSRCKSLSGLYLKKPIKYSDVRTDKYILSRVRSQKG